VDEEQALVAGLKRRDPAALSVAFERFSDKLYRLALSLLHDEQQADGVVQDAFLTLIERIDDFEGRSGIGTWLYRVAYNGAMMRARRPRPQVELDDSDDMDVVPARLVDWATLPEKVLTDHEASAEMQRAIEELSPSLRAVFLLRDVEEMSTAETAQVLRLSEAAVKVRLHRARLALREKLAAYFEERLEVVQTSEASKRSDRG
jgi:RNA polymerase sigma-70 factor (ECF subfamily)